MLQSQGRTEKEFLGITNKKDLSKFSQSGFTGMEERKPICDKVRMESPL
jgi:hypothetical protein